MGAKYPASVFPDIQYVYDGSIAIDVGDLMYHDANDAKPASSQADQGTEVENQRLFARRFCGVATERHLVADAAGTVTVAPLWIGDVTCVSDTYEEGDLLAVDEASSGTALEDQTVVKTENVDLAIGWVTKRVATAATTLEACFVSRTTPIAPLPNVRKMDDLPYRYGLTWVAGQRGKPGLNADILNAAESTRMITDPDFEILGTNGTSALCTANAEGGITLTTAGADADQMILLPHLDTGQSPWTQTTWGTDQETEWECRIKTGASITNCIIWAGLKLTNTHVVATDADQVFFRFEDDHATLPLLWVCVNSIAGVDVETTSGVTALVSTEYHLQIKIDASRIARFYINGALVATTAALTTAIDLIPYVGVQADGAAAAKAIGVRGAKISRKPA